MRRFRTAIALIACSAAVAADAQVNTASGTTVLVDPGTSLRFDIAGAWTIAGGASVVNNGSITLANTAVLLEAPGAPITGSGTERIDTTFGAALNDVDPGGLGLHLSTAIGTGALSVERGHTPFTDYSGHTSIARWFHAQAAQQTGLNATVTLAYDPVELNGLSEPGLVLHRRHGPDVWNWLTGAVDQAAHTVNTSGLDSLGTFTAFEGDLPNLVSPSTMASAAPRLEPNTGTAIRLVWPGQHPRIGFTVVEARGTIIRRSFLAANAPTLELRTDELAQGIYFVRLDNGTTLPFIR